MQAKPSEVAKRFRYLAEMDYIITFPLKVVGANV
jgi:hypothetical protein